MWKWVRVDGTDWGVRGPYGAKVGTTVWVRSKDGTKTKVMIGRMIEPDLNGQTAVYMCITGSRPPSEERQSGHCCCCCPRRWTHYRQDRGPASAHDEWYEEYPEEDRR